MNNPPGTGFELWWPRFALIASSCVFVFLLGFKLPFTAFLNESDHHMFLYEGMRLFDGDTMYRDFFQFTFPGSQGFYWLLFSVFGVKYWILPATIVLIAAASVWSVLKVSTQVISGRLYLLLPSCLFIFFGFRWLGLDGAHRMFSPIFVMLAIWILLRQRNLVGWLSSGAFCALASFFTQQRGMLTLLAIVIFLVIDGWNTKAQLRQILQAAGAVCLSFFVVLGALCAYFIFAAGADNFFYATFAYPAKYYRFAIYNNVAILPVDLANTLQIGSFSKAFAALPALFYLLVLPIAYLCFWTLYFFRRGGHDWEFWRNIVLVALVGTFLTFTTTAPNASRLFQVSMPGLVVITWFCVYIKDHSQFGAAKLIPKFLTLVTVLFILAGFLQAYRLQRNDFQIMETPTGSLAYTPAPIVDERYGFLLTRTKPGDYLYEAYQPYIYFPLRLRNPTMYGQIWDTDYTRPEHVSESIDGLKANPPRYILWNNDYNKPLESRAKGDHIGPLSDYLLQHYRPAGKMVTIPEGRIQVWELIN